VGVRNSQAMRTAVTSHYNVYWIRHFNIEVVVMDGESSAAKAALETNKVEFALLPAGVRSIIQGLPFRTCRQLLAWIVLYVVYITNLMSKRHGFREGAVSAR
jgi:hypothetical protein